MISNGFEMMNARVDHEEGLAGRHTADLCIAEKSGPNPSGSANPNRANV